LSSRLIVSSTVSAASRCVRVQGNIGYGLLIVLLDDSVSRPDELCRGVF